ncbi:MAG: discoidin domain-containing protein [Pelomonas sp.]|nr:discoidin domain-containing protein [Roseateles sp.]
MRPGPLLTVLLLALGVAPGARLALAAQAPTAALDLREPWQASASDQVRAELAAETVDGRAAQCLRYDFGGVAGYAVMRRAWPASWPRDWPEDFVLAATLQGDGAPNALQIKFVDASGQNVWWVDQPGFAPSAAPQQLRIKRRQISFAWGPDADRRLRRSAAIEFVVATTGAAARGGHGRLCLTGLSLSPRAPQTDAPPLPRVTGGGARLSVDLGRERDFDGLLLRWARPPRTLRVSASLDGRHWQTIATRSGDTPTARSPNPLTALWLPEHSARWLRLDGDAGMNLSALALPSPEPGGDADWPDRNAMLAALARELPRGTLPRAFSGAQNYWTLVGVDGGGAHTALLDEAGAVELGRGGASVEPRLRRADGEWLDASNAAVGQSLADGDLPLPSAHLAWPGLQLDVDAAADGPAAAPRLLMRYVLRNTGAQAQTLDFALALRPWQVNPPQQFLNTPGGASEVRRLDWADGVLALNGAAIARPLFAPDAVTALPFAAGLGLDPLAAAPALTRLDDPDSLASALLRRRVTLAPGASLTLGSAFALAPTPDKAPAAPADLDAAFAAVAAQWRERLGGVSVQLPPGAPAALAPTLHLALAQILLSRDGAALRPGTRAYARSWIRDGAMMVEALARLGRADVARDYVDWFAPQLFADGKVPCCIDAHGADPVVENDADGEFVAAVATVWRATRDDAWLRGHWPQVQAVVAHLERLRAQSRADAATPPNARGLLPPSISHEGYADKPAWSFWDDDWGLRGYKDAVQLAAALGDAASVTRYAAARDAFAADLAAAVRATAARFGLATLSGAADRGDVDPTSSTLVFDPVQAEDLLPHELIANTFARYAADAAARAAGTRPQGDYTPYELRNVGALVRLGDADAAQALLAFFLADQRPQAWHQWAEVVGREPRAPRFIGDMPHAWVASDFLRSALDLFAFERDADASLVLGAGVTARWRESGDVGIAGLRTSCGRLDWRLLRRGAGWVALIDHRPERLAACGRRLVLRWPGTAAPPRARDGAGRELSWQGRELALPPDATRVDLEPMGEEPR